MVVVVVVVKERNCARIPHNNNYVHVVLFVEQDVCRSPQGSHNLASPRHFLKPRPASSVFATLIRDTAAVIVIVGTMVYTFIFGQSVRRNAITLPSLSLYSSLM